MGEEPDPESETEPTDDHRPAAVLLNGSHPPEPQEIREHPDIEASPTEVYQYRQAQTAQAEAEAAVREADNNETMVKFILGTVLLVAAWEGFETAVKAARY
jgi:hypothetical protein